MLQCLLFILMNIKNYFSGNFTVNDDNNSTLKNVYFTVWVSSKVKDFR